MNVFNILKGEYSSRHARPGAINANDTPCVKTIWIGIFNVCQVPPNFIKPCESRGRKSQEESDPNQPHGKMEGLSATEREDGRGEAAGEMGVALNLLKAVF